MKLCWYSAAMKMMMTTTTMMLLLLLMMMMIIYAYGFMQINHTYTYSDFLGILCCFFLGVLWHLIMVLEILSWKGSGTMHDYWTISSFSNNNLH